MVDNNFNVFLFGQNNARLPALFGQPFVRNIMIHVDFALATTSIL